MGVVKVSAGIMREVLFGCEDKESGVEREFRCYGMMKVRGEDLLEVEVECENSGNWFAMFTGRQFGRDLYWRVVYGVGGGEVGCRYGLGYRLDVVRRDEFEAYVYLLDKGSCERLGDGEEVPFRMLGGIYGE